MSANKMITQEEKDQLRQLYAACKDQSMKDAKIECSREQYLFIKRLLTSFNEESWLESLSEVELGSALSLSDYIKRTEKGKVLLQLASLSLKEENSDALANGVLLMRGLFSRSGLQWPLFNHAKEYFAQDFSIHRNKVEAFIRQIKDWSKYHVTEVDINEALAGLLESSKKVFSGGKKDIPLNYEIILNFLKDYKHLDEEINSIRERITLGPSLNFTATDQVIQPDIEEGTAQAVSPGTFFRGRRAAFDAQNKFSNFQI